MPEEGVQNMTHEDILSFEEIVDVVKASKREGITRIRLTGGEPLVRKGIVTLVRMINEVDGIEEVAMTTNGIMLEKFAEDLASAGLKRVNISLDTIDSEKYKEITRGGDINKVLRGIKSAVDAGLNPVKLNCVVDKPDDIDAMQVEEFAKENNLKVQFINQMNLEGGYFSKVKGGEGGNCSLCNRIRLMANGNIKPCLFNESGFNVRTYGIEEAINLAVENKPKTGTKNRTGNFYNIGG
jgi:cyclic pyranopterin phosphate synthase